MVEKPYVIVDLDGTLCNDDHRKHLAEAKQWDEYHSLCHLDKPNPDMVATIKAFFLAEHPVLAVTGRNEKWRKMTANWLHDNGLGHCIEQVFMRPDDDYTKAGELKLRLLKENAMVNPSEVLVAFDDTEKVIEVFRNAGIKTYQVK